MRTDFDKQQLIEGITPFITAELESHKRLTAGIWDEAPIITVNDTLAIRFIDTVFNYVTERTLTFQETALFPLSTNERPGKFSLYDWYPSLDEAKNSLEHKVDGPSLKDAVMGLHELVMRNLSTDVRKPITDSPAVKNLISFVFTAYLHYSMDFEEVGMFYREDDLVPAPFGGRLFTYEELAFISGVKRSTIDTKIKNEELIPVNLNNMYAFNNNLINDAIGNDLMPAQRRNAFVDIFQSMSYLMSAQRAKYRPTQVAFEVNGENVFPQYWKNNYFVDHIGPWLEKKYWDEFKEWLNLSEAHWYKLKQGKAGITFCQARMADLYIQLTENPEDLPKHLFAAHMQYI